MAKQLSKRRELFISEYLVDLNATRAYIAAGYSPNGASQSARTLLSNTQIQQSLSRVHGQHLDKLDITAERVLAELAKIAFFDPRQFFNDDGSAKQVKDLDDVSAMAVAGFELVELSEGTGDHKYAYGLIKKFKLVDKLRALELLGKHLKLFTDKVEHAGKDGGPIPVAAVDLSRVKDDDLEQLERILRSASDSSAA